MSKVVTDASLSVKWVTVEALQEQAHALLEAWVNNETEILIPLLWEYELDSALRRKERNREISTGNVETAWRFLAGISLLKIHYRPEVRQRAYEIAKRANQRAVYDSIYAALAELEECEFWTADEEYCKAVRGFLPHVKYLGDYPLPQTSEPITETENR